MALGASGTVTIDALAPYEVFASSPKFTVYTVAATAAPAPTDGGPAIVPTYTFNDTRSGRAPSPDIVVVPAVDDPSDEQEAPLREWLVEQSRAGTRVLGVCAGSGILAATGLLDGRQATGHWSRLGALAKQRPQVRWVRGQRYVQDGLITTTAGITSGVPGALRVMADVAGRDEAERVGDWPVALNTLIPWGRPTLGIALRDGIGEIDLASAFEVYDVSYAARPVPLSDRGAVTTRHGMVLLTDTVAGRRTTDRLAVPGAGGVVGVSPGLEAWAAHHRVPVDAVHASSPGFDGALEYLARHSGRATAQSAAKMVDYPTAQLHLPDRSGGARTVLLLALVAAVSCSAALVLARWP